MKRTTFYTFHERIRQPLQASVVRGIQRVSCYCQYLVTWLCVGGGRGVIGSEVCVRGVSLGISTHVWCICHVQTGTCLNVGLVPMPHHSRAAGRSSACRDTCQALLSVWKHRSFDSLDSSSALLVVSSLVLINGYAAREHISHNPPRSCILRQSRNGIAQA
jgi:hypothetical protein